MLENLRIGVVSAREDIDALLDEREKLTMNLFSLILSKPNACIWSNHADFIICQSNERTPIWAWFRENMELNASKQAAQIIMSRIAVNPNVHFNAAPVQSGKVMQLIRNASSQRIVMNMNAYACRNVIAPSCTGQMISPTAAHRFAMATLLQQLTEDGEHQRIPRQSADDFANAMVNSKQLFLWIDEGEVCAMAMVAHKTGNMARINTVVTERSKRGRSYAGILVAQICGALLADGRVPMLYADAANPSSNRAYQKIGFEKVGVVTEYRWESDNSK